jgi:hypothetical protein
MVFILVCPGEGSARVLARALRALRNTGRSSGFRALQSLTLRHCGLSSEGALRLRPNSILNLPI